MQGVVTLELSRRWHYRGTKVGSLNYACFLGNQRTVNEDASGDEVGEADHGHGSFALAFRPLGSGVMDDLLGGAEQRTRDVSHRGDVCACERTFRVRGKIVSENGKSFVFYDIQLIFFLEKE